MTQRQNLADIVAYLCARYPHKSELSNARLTKLVYLADWKSVQASGRQLTNIDWVFNHYGPWVPDVVESAQHDDRFDIQPGVNAYGSPRITIAVKPDVESNASELVDRRTSNVLDLVIAETRSMYFNPFIRYVYATLPVRITPKGNLLPLAEIRSEHPEAQVPLPQAVTSGALSAEDYTTLRSELSQVVAERLLDPAWNVRTDPPVTGIPSQHDLRIRRVTLWPDFTVETRPDGLSVTAAAATAADAEIPPHATTPAGFTINPDDSTPWAVALNTSLTAHIRALVSLPVQAGSVTLTHLQLAPPTTSAGSMEQDV